jgi:hypothetical protein
MGLSKNLKPLDRFDNVLRGWGRLGFARRSRKMDGFSEQIGGVCINPHTMRGSLAGEFGLKLQPDFNGDGH